MSASLGRAVFTGKLPLAGEALHPIDPLILSQTRTSFSLLVLLPMLVGARRGWQRIRLPVARSHPMPCARHAGRRRVELFLLRRHPENERRHRDHPAIHRAGLGVALRGRSRTAEALAAEKSPPSRSPSRGIALTIGIDRREVGVAASISIPAGVSSPRLLASFSFAFYNVGGHSILARYDRWRVLTWTLASASVFWLFVNPPWKVVAAHYAPAQWGFLFVFSMISVLGSFSLYFLGLQYLEPTRAIIASCLEPVFSILLAAALLGEGVRPIQTLGIVLVLSAIVIVQLPGRGAVDQESVVVDPIE